MKLRRSIGLTLVLSHCLISLDESRTVEIEVSRAISDREGNTYESVYSIDGLPQQEFLLNQNYPNGSVVAIKFKGTRAYVIEPSRSVDPQRRWIWIAPLWLAFNAPKQANSRARFFVEQALNAGFHIVGLDVGTTCGSPKGAMLYEEFYRWLVRTRHLSPKVRLFGWSNGGLISYAWAFRYPDHVERILCVNPVTDMRTWPKLEKVSGPERITPAGLAYPYDSVKELERHLPEVNPIDNLASLAKRRIPIFHIHGDKDELVPMSANSVELVNRYRALGGDARLEVFEGLGHGAREFLDYQPAADFLTAR